MTKTKQRLGTQVIDLFKATTTAEPEQLQKQVIAKPEPLKLTVKSTVTLSHHNIYWLDRLSSEIRVTQGVVLDRSALIRAVITALEQSGVDLRNSMSEEEIIKHIMTKLTA